MAPAGRFVYRVRFTKTGPARLYSHHDLMRLFERAMRRAALPVSLSEGFNPRPRMTFLSALPLGVESLDEYMEVELSDEVPVAEFLERMKGELPEGMRLEEAVASEERVVAVEATYESEVPEGFKPRLEAVGGVGELVVERKAQEGVRKVDIRPFVVGVEKVGGKVSFRIRMTDHGSARPEEILKLLGMPGARTIRVKTLLAPKSGGRG